jgi:hypothetical protein
VRLNDNSASASAATSIAPAVTPSVAIAPVIAAEPRRWRVLLRRFGPYAIAGAALAAILSKYSIKDIFAEMQRGNALSLLPWAAVVLVVSLFLVSAADTLIIRASSAATGRPPAYWSVLMAKAGCGLLGALGYAAGHGGYGVWIARKTGIGARLTGGVVLYIISSELLAVSFVASLAVFVGGAEAPSNLKITAATLVVLLSLFKIVGPLLRGPRPSVFEPWRLVSPLRAVLQEVIRIVQISILVMCTWFAARAFGMPIPAEVMASYMPLSLIIGSLPVTIAGFGAVQGAWLLLSPWASGEQVLAFSVLWQLSCMLVGFLRGIPFVRRVVAEIDEGARKPAPS